MAKATSAYSFAEQKRRSMENQKRRTAAVGGGGGGSGAKPIELGGKKFWGPRGIPLAGSGDSVILTGQETYLKDNQAMLGILVDAVDLIYAHSPQRFEDISVLPPWVQAASRTNRDVLKVKKYICTFDENAGPDDEGWAPNEAWTQEQDAKGNTVFVISHPTYANYWVEVVQTPDGFCIRPPTTHRFVPASATEPFEVLEEAMHAAEKLLAQAFSCTFCAQIQFDFKQRTKKEDALVWDAQENVLLPFFSLRWLFTKAGEGTSDIGKFIYGDNPDDVPDGKADLAIREGWSWLCVASKKTKQGNRYRSFENFQQYIAQTATICSNCLGQNGERTDRAAHQIFVSRLCCTECGKDVYDPKKVKRADPYKDPTEKDGVLDMGTAGWFQLMTSFTDCPHCKASVIPKPVYECSTCKKPTPLKVSNILTSIRKDAGGFYTFSMVEDDDTGRIYYPDWSSTRLTNPPTAKWEVEDAIRPGLDAHANEEFLKYLPMGQSDTYMRLSPLKQGQLIGATVLGLEGKHSEER